MHILLTGNTAFVIANFRAGLMRALVRDGHVLTALVPEDAHVEALRAIPCDVVPLRLNGRGMHPLQEAGGFLSMLDAIRRARPDVVLGFTVKNNLYGGFAARLLGVPFLPNVTGLGTSFADAGLLNRLVVELYKRGFGKLPIVFFQNQDDGDHFTRLKIVGRDQIRVLPGSGVDLEAFRPAPLPGGRCDPTFLLVARMLREKGIAEFVEAARIVRARFPGARFKLLGPFETSPRSAVPRSLIEAWVAEGVVEYLGVAKDVRPVLAAADCVVLPSYYREGTPRVLLEAAAMARAVVTTDMPGCRDAVEHGTTGFICRPRDAADLGEALLHVAAMEPAARAALGQAGRRRVERRFDERIVIEEYRRAIDQVVVARG